MVQVENKTKGIAILKVTKKNFLFAARRVDSPVTRATFSAVYAASLSAAIASSTAAVSAASGNASSTKDWTD